MLPCDLEVSYGCQWLSSMLCSRFNPSGDSFPLVDCGISVLFTTVQSCDLSYYMKLMGSILRCLAGLSVLPAMEACFPKDLLIAGIIGGGWVPSEA